LNIFAPLSMVDRKLIKVKYIIIIITIYFTYD
jgi:hypothetical protein